MLGQPASLEVVASERKVEIKVEESLSYGCKSARHHTCPVRRAVSVNTLSRCVRGFESRTGYQFDNKSIIF